MLYTVIVALFEAIIKAFLCLGEKVKMVNLSLCLSN
jgi:hypothetical protein